MKVFGIGLGRTGTTSLTVALEELGLTAQHFPQSYDAVSKNDGLTDTSIALGYKYLDFMFPDARFILTVRPIDRWLASIEAFFSELANFTIHDRYHRLHKSLYGTSVFDERRMREAYLRHQEDVADHFRGRSCLLTLDVTSGDPYQALADFLGVDAPDSPFPHLNDRDWMRSAMARTISPHLAS
jgi:Sulfotransferase domain